MGFHLGTGRNHRFAPASYQRGVPWNCCQGSTCDSSQGCCPRWITRSTDDGSYLSSQALVGCGGSRTCVCSTGERYLDASAAGCRVGRSSERFSRPAVCWLGGQTVCGHARFVWGVSPPAAARWVADGGARFQAPIPTCCVSNPRLHSEPKLGCQASSNDEDDA